MFVLLSVMVAVRLPSMNFQYLHELLRLELLRRIEQGSLTGTKLAQQAGFQQAHISNFLNKKRSLSLEGLDRVLAAQNLTVDQLLPVDLNPDGKPTDIRDYIYEQSPVDMLDRLMPRYVEVAVFRALLETIASYQAARMTAMDKASSNARDVIDTRTLNMNRIRQAAITKEIIEVVSGAAASE